MFLTKVGFPVPVVSSPLHGMFKRLNTYKQLFSLKSTASVVWWSEFLATERRCIEFPVRYECRRKPSLELRWYGRSDPSRYVASSIRKGWH
jgi:hypothetical protein